MNKILGFSMICAAMLHASGATVAPITVVSTKLSDVSGEEIKSADLAEALGSKAPSVNLVRRSGIANDVLLRGQKRDNINITIDGAKIHGACPNRMDPPTSHVVTHNIESIEIIEGPYNVEEFGVLSGGIEVTTKEPAAKSEGEVGLNFGSFGYKKVGATVSGGNERVQVMVVGSAEESDQYEDGDGNTMAEQVATKVADTSKHYKDSDIEAYEKKSFMGKVNIAVADNQQLKLSYTNNQSDDILYPNSPMDADYDDSELINAEYVIKNTSDYSKELSIQAYRTEVDHPMSTEKRNSSMMMVMVNHLTTETQGLKIKNRFEASGTAIKVGLDASNRNWDGAYSNGFVSINDADTENRAFFVEAARNYGDLNVNVGARYDDTSITSGDATIRDNEYNSLSANIFVTYKMSASTKLFGGFGKSSRVPDARELYFESNTGANIGTDTLDETTNYEADLGIEHKYETADVKLKTFYSRLDDYIYHSRSVGLNQFDNIDATIYGIELSGAYYPMDQVSVDYGAAYLNGEKETLPTGHTDRDLADIPPLKANVALNYYYGNENYARMEVVAAKSWDTYDSDVQEQEIDGYTVLNLKVSHDVTDSFNVTSGVDNVFDETYALSNTYNDLKLLSAGSSVMLLNEPGRYFYVNAKYRF